MNAFQHRHFDKNPTDGAAAATRMPISKCLLDQLKGVPAPIRKPAPEPEKTRMEKDHLDSLKTNLASSQSKVVKTTVAFLKENASKIHPDDLSEIILATRMNNPNQFWTKDAILLIKILPEKYKSKLYKQIMVEAIMAHPDASSQSLDFMLTNHDPIKSEDFLHLFIPDGLLPKFNAIPLAQYEDKTRLSQMNAIAIANILGARILSNKELDWRLALSEAWKSEKEVYPVWTGTLVAFNENGAKLGKTVQCTNHREITYIIRVPKEYQGETNAILVVNHGFLADGTPLIVPRPEGNTITYEITDDSQIALLRSFPNSKEWCHSDNKFGIPLGNGIPSSNSNARYFDKLRTYVGLVARGYYFYGHDYDNRRFVCAYDLPFSRFGVLISDDFLSRKETKVNP